MKEDTSTPLGCKHGRNHFNWSTEATESWDTVFMIEKPQQSIINTWRVWFQSRRMFRKKVTLPFKKNEHNKTTKVKRIKYAKMDKIMKVWHQIPTSSKHTNSTRKTLKNNNKKTFLMFGNQTFHSLRPWGAVSDAFWFSHRRVKFNRRWRAEQRREIKCTSARSKPNMVHKQRHSARVHSFC